MSIYPFLLSFFVGILFFQCSPTVGKKVHSDEHLPVRQRIIEDAAKTVGSRYKYGGTGNRGFDCSGLVYTIYKNHEFFLPRSARDMIKYGQKINKRQVQPGDLAFFKNIGRKVDHVAIVYKIDRDGIWLIHSTTSRGVITQNLESSSYWSKRLIQFNSII